MGKKATLSIDKAAVVLAKKNARIIGSLLNTGEDQIAKNRVPQRSNEVLNALILSNDYAPLPPLIWGQRGV